jgi:hypothetical protein
VHQIRLEVRIECLKVGVGHDWVVDLVGELAVVVGEALEVAVAVLDDVGVDLGFRAQVRDEGLPDEFLGFREFSLCEVLEVETPKEPGIETHICEETRVRVRVTERINLPAYSGSYSEFLH